jgi:hypothetical protein
MMNLENNATEPTDAGAALAVPPVLPDLGAPDGVSYPGEATYATVPTGYEAQAMQGTYFYYFAFEPPSMAAICYIFESKENATSADYNRWIAEARRKREKGVASDSPDDVEWNRPSYLAFTLDAENWSFFDEKKGKKRINKSLYFNKVTLPKGGNRIEHRKNTSFFNAETLQPGVDGVDLPILQVQNHHLKYGRKRRRRPDECDKWDHYKFDIYFRVGFQPPLTDENGDERKLTLVIDPTGKNTGP